MFKWLTKLFVQESLSAADIFGTPVDFAQLYAWRDLGLGAGSLYGPSQKPEKATTLRTLADHTRARQMARHLYESNPNAQAGVNGLVAYIVGSGSNISVQAKGRKSKISEEVVAAVLDVVDDCQANNAWWELELEMAMRLIRDGEFFLRLFPDEDGITKLRFVEPDQIQPPTGKDAEGPWSYGIYTPTGDVARPVSYNVHDFVTIDDEEVPAQFIVHRKLATSNQKRGIPALYAPDEEFRGSTKLRHATREGEKVRNSIAYFRKWALPATSSQITSLQTANTTTTIQRASGPDLIVQRIDPGTVVDAPMGMEVVMPPASDSSDASASSVKQALEAAAAALQVPLWLLSGIADNVNYAASLTAESPFTRTIERHQGMLSRAVDKVFSSVVEIAVEQGILESSVLDQADLLVEYPSPVVRDADKETMRYALLHERKVISKATWATREGLDHEQEQQRLKQEPQEALPVDPTILPAIAGQSTPPEDTIKT